MLNSKKEKRKLYDANRKTITLGKFSRNKLEECFIIINYLGSKKTNFPIHKTINRTSIAAHAISRYLTELKKEVSKNG